MKNENIRELFSPKQLQIFRMLSTYYDKQQVGLGRRFDAELNVFLIGIGTSPFFQLRYDSIRCLPFKNSHSWFTLLLMKGKIK